MLRDNEVINPSEFPDSVASGMTMEMSIVMHRKPCCYGERKCPRCGNISNKPLTLDNGWIEWEVPSIYARLLAINDIKCSQHCSGLFQLCETDGNTEVVSPVSYVLRINRSTAK
jgi:hypothetical protein